MDTKLPTGANAMTKSIQCGKDVYHQIYKLKLFQNTIKFPTKMTGLKKTTN